MWRLHLTGASLPHLVEVHHEGRGGGGRQKFVQYVSCSVEGLSSIVKESSSCEQCKLSISQEEALVQREEKRVGSIPVRQLTDQHADWHKPPWCIQHHCQWSQWSHMKDNTIPLSSDWETDIYQLEREQNCICCYPQSNMPIWVVSAAIRIKHCKFSDAWSPKGAAGHGVNTADRHRNSSMLIKRRKGLSISILIS